MPAVPASYQLPMHRTTKHTRAYWAVTLGTLVAQDKADPWLQLGSPQESRGGAG